MSGRTDARPATGAPWKREGSLYPAAEARPLRVCELPKSRQPRELFDRHGARHVSDEALLAILLRTGGPGRNALMLAEHLLEQFGSLAELAAAPPQILRMTPGVGRVKAQILKAAFELARRLSERPAPERVRIQSPRDVEAVLREDARVADREIFWVLVLNAKNRLVCPPRAITKGLRNASLAHPREVFREAVPWNGISVILAHNHPSGDPTPSPEDLRVTRQLVEAGRALDIPVLDHIILGGPEDAGRLRILSLRESEPAQFS